MFLFNKDGYLKFGITEIKEIICKHAEQEEAKKSYWNQFRSTLDIARTLIPVEPLPPGALPIYDKDLDVGMMVVNLKGVKKLSKEIPCTHCGGSGKLPCYDGECYICAMDDYCADALSCSSCLQNQSPASLSAAQQICAEEDARILVKVELGPKNTVYCSKCNTPNEYLDTPNQPDGTHICYGCRSGF